MNIIIINQPLSNRGDEAAHKSLIRMLNKEIDNAKIKVLHVGGNQDSINQFKVEGENNTYINLKPFKAHGYSIKKGFNYGITRFLSLIHPTHRKVAKEIKSADLVICSPGGICMGPYQSWDHLWFLKLGVIYNKKIAYYGRSFGPFPLENKSQILFKNESLKMLPKFDFLSLRDSVTQGYAKRLNLDFISTVDTALLDTPHVNVPDEISEQIGSNYIVYVPNELKWNPKFISIDSNLLEAYYLSILKYLLQIKEDVKIVMLPQLFNYDEGNDVDYFKYLKSKITDNSRIKVINDQYSSDIQQTIISKAEYLIGARYHSVVFSVNNKTPFTALSYEHKISGLLKDLDLDSNMVDFSFLLEKNPLSANEKMNENLSVIYKMLDETILKGKSQKVKQTEARELAETGKKQFLKLYKSTQIISDLK